MWGQVQCELRCGQPRFHLVELLDVALLELGSPLAGEAHDQEGEPVASHYHLALQLILPVEIRGRRKVAPSEIRITFKVVDGFQNIFVPLAESFGDFQAIRSGVA